MENSICLPAEYGSLEFFCHEYEGDECVVAINRENLNDPFLRIHSSCLFSEAFHTNDCDCASQLNGALEYISKYGGVVIYLYQEGRNIGISKKIQAIKLQQSKGYSTVEAFSELGYEVDPRSYDTAIDVLRYLNIKSVKIGTSNPKKIAALESSGIEVIERIHIEVNANSAMQKYIDNKVEVLGHHEKN